MKKALLLAVGNDYCRDEWGLSVIPPMGILSVGSFLAEQGVPVELIDVQLDFGFGLTEASERVVLQRVARYISDQSDNIAWIGISQLSNTNLGIALAQEIHTKQPKIPIVFGGYSPSGNYQRLLQNYPFITAVVRGDGEAAALQISRSLVLGQSFLSDQTPNLAWLDGEEIHTNPIQPVAVGNLPLLDFHLLQNKACYQFAGMMTSRGCPFKCNYCLEDCMRPYAEYHLAWVDKQLECIKSHMSNKRVSIVDAIFGVGHKRTLEVCRIMHKYGLKYAIESRADVLSPDLLPALSEAGVEFIFLGIESSSIDTLLRMKKVHSNNKAESYVRNALGLLKVCFDNNVTPILGFMLGFPGDTEADLQATLIFVKEVRRLYEQVSARNGIEPGFILAPQPTKVFNGSSLAGYIGNDYPEITLQSDPVEGERIVVSPSPGLDLDLLSRYIGEIEELGVYTPRVMELSGYFGFSSKELIESHPELTDEEGVSILCESIKRIPVQR